jgi:GMP synthase-like glutamine amidotransferase
VLVRAFGPSRVERNPKGWEVGSTRIELTGIGRKLIWGTTGEEDPGELPDHLMTQQIHGDICTSLPSDFTLLASSAISPIQGIAHFYPEDKRPPAFVHSDEPLPPDPWRRVHMIAFQGHPEWEHSVIVCPFPPLFTFSALVPVREP